jgi:hypothetical protein
MQIKVKWYQCLIKTLQVRSKDSQVKTQLVLWIPYTPPYTHRQRYVNEDKIVLNTDNFMIFAILHIYNFILVVDTTVQNNDNEISLHFKPMGLIFMNYSV